MIMSVNNRDLARIVSWVAGIVAASVALMLPAGYFALRHGALSSAMQTSAEITAESVTHAISSNPDLWMFQTVRLKEMITRRTAGGKSELVRVFDPQGDLIAEVGEIPERPTMNRSVILYDTGTAVGRLDVSRSLRDLWLGTAGAAGLGLLLAAAAFIALRVLPLRALRRVTEALFEEKERAEVTLHSIGDAVITTDAGERIEYLNPVAERLTGWHLAEARGRPLSEILRLVNEMTMKSVENPVHRALAEGNVISFGGNVQLLHKDGRAISIEDSAAPIRDRGGSIIGGVLVFHDVSAARTLAQRLSWQATHDALTGLVNRREFEGRIEAALASARNSDKHHVVCYMDLDQFKVVNDTCGHAAGDELLKQLALLLQSKVRESDTLARLGGDEFGLLLDGCPLDRAQLIAADLLATVRDFRFNWEGKVFSVGLSAGLATIVADSKNGAEALSFADTACYWAKEQGRNRVCVYRVGDTDMADRRREMGWVARINKAMEENRFTLYYQSYLELNIGSGSRKHIEVLLRMIDEEGNLVLPGSFLPAAERYNLMPMIDRWVVGTVFAQYQTLVTRLGDQPLTCAINLSGTSLNAEGFFDFIRQQAHEHGLPRHSICFEITESAAINNLRKVAEFMKEIQAIGFLFALDDFGTGTSSFGYLKNLPVDYLKIDGGFVKDMERDPIDRAMTETINRIGHIMNVKTVAEFAESQAIVEQLKAMGVDYAQGYGVSMPAPLIGPVPRSDPLQRPLITATETAPVA
jgi:diguanylate cyclase (GGDEF)-like protein/PAS domain S-box-containing protein